jgi:hypothetical protein
MGRARRNLIRPAVVGLCVALCAAMVGCGRPAPAPTGGSTNSRAEKARKEAESLALSGVAGGAAAQAAAEPETFVRRKLPDKIAIFPNKGGTSGKGTPVSAPVVVPAVAPAQVAQGSRTAPRSGWVIREHVACKIPSPTEAEAEEDTLNLARDVVERKLAELDPPLRHVPSLGEVRTEFLRKDSRVVRPPDAAQKEELATNGIRTDGLVYVEYDVEVTAEQVRELRAQARVSAGLRVVGMVLAVALAGFLFLRADEWTKGYLTRWLALAAVTLGGAIAAALIFV